MLINSEERLLCSVRSAGQLLGTLIAGEYFITRLPLAVAAASILAAVTASKAPFAAAQTSAALQGLGSFTLKDVLHVAIQLVYWFIAFLMSQTITNH
jgi:hypothetical protein